jgi:hypothetical protein
MVGNWVAGVLQGSAQYSQPAYTMQSTFTKDIPDGPCKFESTAFRKLDKSLPHTIAAYIRSPDGPVLTHEGRYEIPEGAAKDPDVDEDGNEIEPDPDAPKMPAYPKYTGLTYTASSQNPSPGQNTVYPPVGVDVPACIKPSTFSVVEGLSVTAK